jgi:hypothetical protein
VIVLELLHAPIRFAKKLANVMRQIHRLNRQLEVNE